MPENLKVLLPFAVVFFHLSQSLRRLQGERKPGFRGQDEPVGVQPGRGEGRTAERKASK